MKKAPEKIKTYGIIANSEKASSRAVVREAARCIEEQDGVLAMDVATAKLSGVKGETYPSAAALASHVDLLVVCGGDGTMLRVVREIEGSRTPVFGINVGRLGFLTAVPSHDLKKAFQKIEAGDYTTETRPLIEAVGVASGARIRLPSLNDFVISRGAIPRMIELEISINGAPVTRYRCDGLIVSSPTGSTAYSLSAGGAIIAPDANVFAITPICPHTLTNRSVIVSLDAQIQVKVVSEKVDTTISADGQVQLDLDAGDVITIKRHRRSVRLLHLGDTSFFDTVRRKLHWSGSNV